MEFTVYPIRWFLLGLISVATFCQFYFSNAFAISNTLVSAYYYVEPIEVDVLTTVDTLGSLPAVIFLAIISDRVGIRMMTLALVTFLATGTTIGLIASNFRSLYWMMATSRVIVGLPTGLSIVVPAIFSARWFPENQSATVFAIPVTCISLGAVVASVTFSTVLHPISPINNSMESADVLLMDEANSGLVQSALAWNFTVILMLLLLAWSLLLKYVKDRPPSPPSADQVELILAEERERETYSEEKTLNYIKRRLRLIWEICTKTPFVLLTMSNFLSNSSLSLAGALLPSLLMNSLHGLDDMVPAYVAIIREFVGLFGPLVAGILVDKFKSFKLISCIGNAGLVLSLVGLYVSHVNENMIGLLVGYPVMSFFRMFTLTMYIEFLLETSYPDNKIIVVSTHLGFYNLAIFVFALIERMAMIHRDEATAVLISALSCLFAIFLLALVKPEYKRTEMNKPKESDDDDISNEETEVLVSNVDTGPSEEE